MFPHNLHGSHVHKALVEQLELFAKETRKNHRSQGSLPWTPLRTSSNYRKEGRHVVPIMPCWDQIKIYKCTDGFFPREQTHVPSHSVVECQEGWSVEPSGIWHPRYHGWQFINPWSVWKEAARGKGWPDLRRGVHPRTMQTASHNKATQGLMLKGNVSVD